MANFVDYVGKKKDIYRQREKDNKAPSDQDVSIRM